jgi:hypothetical protein
VIDLAVFAFATYEVVVNGQWVYVVAGFAFLAAIKAFDYFEPKTAPRERSPEEWLRAEQTKTLERRL